MSENSRNFTQAVLAFDAVVQRVAPEGWAQPSPCEGWDAADVVRHQCAVLNGVSAMAESGALARPEPPADDADPTAVWAETRERLMTALDQEGVLQQQGPFWFDLPSIDDVVGFVVWDVVTHTWDLAQATSQPHALADDLVQRAHDIVAPRSEMMAETGRTKAALEIAADAPLLDRYLALVGRQA